MKKKRKRVKNRWTIDYSNDSLSTSSTSHNTPTSFTIKINNLNNNSNINNNNNNNNNNTKTNNNNNSNSNWNIYASNSNSNNSNSINKDDMGKESNNQSTSSISIPPFSVTRASLPTPVVIPKKHNENFRNSRLHSDISDFYLAVSPPSPSTTSSSSSFASGEKSPQNQNTSDFVRSFYPTPTWVEPESDMITKNFTPRNDVVTSVDYFDPLESPSQRQNLFSSPLSSPSSPQSSSLYPSPWLEEPIISPKRPVTSPTPSSIYLSELSEMALASPEILDDTFLPEIYDPNF